MKSLTVVAAIAISSVLGACQPKEDVDPITQLERNLDATNGAWVNGFIFPIYLPENASAEDILVQVFRKPVRDQGLITEYKILESRYLRILGSPGEPQPLAILVSSNIGYQIAVAVFDKNGGYWDVRVFEGWWPPE
jgi:hypothetical protein